MFNLGRKTICSYKPWWQTISATNSERQAILERGMLVSATLYGSSYSHIYPCLRDFPEKS